MAPKRELQFVKVEDYLPGERDGRVRHEYVAGQVFAMTGRSVVHNRITGSFFAQLREKLAGSPCDVFVSDMKVQTQRAFYYPDVMVVCDPADRDPYTKANPTVIVEVTSPTTRSIDEREKRQAYLSIPSLREYLLAEQDRAEVRLLHRADDGQWEEEDLGAGDLIRLRSLNVTISMQTIYEDVWRWPASISNHGDAEVCSETERLNCPFSRSFEILQVFEKRAAGWLLSRLG